MKQIRANIINLAKSGEYDYLVHGCNCQCRMRSGLAKQIVEHFPRSEIADSKTKKGDRSKLGKISLIRYPEVTIVNAYTQFYYGTDFRKLDYEALYCCLEKINDLIKPDEKILVPQIGCGLAGGNWKIVRVMIEETLKDKNVTIVSLS